MLLQLDQLIQLLNGGGDDHPVSITAEAQALKATAGDEKDPIQAFFMLQVYSQIVHMHVTLAYSVVHRLMNGARIILCPVSAPCHFAESFTCFSQDRYAKQPKQVVGSDRKQLIMHQHAA